MAPFEPDAPPAGRWRGAPVTPRSTASRSPWAARRTVVEKSRPACARQEEEEERERKRKAEYERVQERVQQLLSEPPLPAKSAPAALKMQFRERTAMAGEDRNVTSTADAAPGVDFDGPLQGVFAAEDDMVGIPSPIYEGADQEEGLAVEPTLHNHFLAMGLNVPTARHLDWVFQYCNMDPDGEIGEVKRWMCK